MKYIDSEKLIAEIERRIGFYERTYERLHRDDLESSTSYAIASALDKLLSFITSLQQEQPDVDLKEEITPSLVENMLYELGVQSIEDIDGETLAELARHFYELGLNAIKEK